MTTMAARGLAPARTVLPNGVCVLSKETRTAPAVTISAAFQAGNIYDPEDRSGVANLLSRVLDRGTERRTGDDIADDLESRGVALAVGVTRHQLTVTCTCLVEDFDPVLDLIGEMVTMPSFPPEEIETRRGEILTALRQDEDNPAVRAAEGFMGLLYGADHPYGRRAKGTAADVERLTREDLVAFHRARVLPGSLSLVLVGDVTAARVTTAAARAFGGWRAARPEPFAMAPVPRPTGRRRLVLPMMNKAQADIAYGFAAIRRSDPRYYAFWIMNNALGQYGLGGRLGDNIRERQGMAYYVYSAFDANLMEGPLMVRAGVSPTNVDRAVAAIDEEIASIAASGVTEAELADTRRYLIGSIPRNLETNAGIAAFLQMVEHFGLGLDYDQRLPDLLGGVTLEEVREAAAGFSTDRATVVIAGPYQE